jgi:trans-2-enoyl-CoA reductase
MRLKEVALSYNLPEKLISRINISKLTLTISARNLYTLTDYSGYDPEVSIYGGSVYAKGVDYGAYPNAKTFLVGMNVTF